jgi:outer membrane protein TolC
VRRSFESARAQAAASANDLTVVGLTVETGVAQFYYTLRSLDTQAQILTETVVSYREQVRLLSVQLRAGLVSSIVLYQAQAQLEATLAQQRDVERARADLEHALAILCGRPAPSFGVASNPLHEASPPAVPQGLRSGPSAAAGIPPRRARPEGQRPRHALRTARATSVRNESQLMHGRMVCQTLGACSRGPGNHPAGRSA